MNTSAWQHSLTGHTSAHAALSLPQRAPAGVSDELVEAAIRVANDAPDPRADRVQIAVEHLVSGTPDAQAVAQAVILSILADSSR